MWSGSIGYFEVCQFPGQGFLFSCCSRRACLKICTNHSAKPFVAGWYGVDRMCLITFFLVKGLNPSATNWGPLSLTNCSRKLWWWKAFAFRQQFWWPLSKFICTTSVHLECASTTTRNISPKNGPAKSTPSVAREELASTMSALLCHLFNYFIHSQPPHVASGPGFLLTTPRWPLWSSSNTCIRYFGGITTHVSHVRQLSWTVTSSFLL